MLTKALYLSKEVDARDFSQNLSIYLDCQHTSDLQNLQDMQTPLIINEDQWAAIDDLASMHEKPPLFIRVKALNVEQLRDILSKIPLCGILYGEMSPQEIAQLIQKKSRTAAPPLEPSHSPPRATSLAETGPTESFLALLAQLKNSSQPPHRGSLTTLGFFLEEIIHQLHPPIEEITSLCQKWTQKYQNNSSQASPNFLSDIQGVQESAERCLRIIQNLYEFAKGQEKTEPLSLNQLVKSTLPLAQSSLHSLNYTLELQAHNDTIQGSPELLRQVLLNLIQNAHQASLSHVTSPLSIRTYESSNGFICLEVQDLGEGISKEHLPQIFDPFFTTKTDGTGLGLHLCQKIVHKFKGQIHVQSELQKGTTFSILWPK